MNSNNTVLKGKKLYIWSFALSAAAMFLCMVISGVIGGGRTLMESDLSATYIPTLRNFAKTLLSGERLDYSWNICLGMNTTSYYAYYVGSSFVNLLFLIFYAVDPAIIVIPVILIKTGLAGFGFAYFCKKLWKKEDVFVLIFSLFYAMSSFQVFMNSINIIWMDAVYILPFLLAFLVEFVEEKHWKKMILCYIYLFTANFYMAYMVGIFSALFFILYVGLMWKENGAGEKLKKVICYGGLVLLAIGCAAVILLPAGLFLFQNRVADSTDVLSLSANLLQIYNQMFLGANADVMYTQPSIYAGLPALLLLPFFFGGKGVERREKVAFGILFGVLSISFLLPVMCLLWHAFDVPDGWPFRFSYIFTLLTCTMACKAMEEMGEHRKKILWICMGCNGIFYVAMSFYQGMVTPEAISNTPVRIVLNLLLMGIWVLLLCKNQEMEAITKLQGETTEMGPEEEPQGVTTEMGPEEEPQDESPEFQPGLYRRIALGLAVLEVLCNGFFMMEMHERPDKKVYDSWYRTGKQVEKLLETDTDLYRVDLGRDRQYNTDTFFGFNGVGDFGTLEHYEVRQALSSLGIYTSPRVQCPYGVTPFTRLLLGMKYQVEDMYAMSEMPVARYEDDLGMGFMVNRAVAENSYADGNVFENMNGLASSMVGERMDIFRQIPYENIVVESYGMNYGQDENGTQYFWADLADPQMKYITFKVPDEGREVYVAFDHGESLILLDDPIVIDEYTDIENYQIYDYRRLGVRYAKKMEQVDGIRMMAIGMAKNLTADTFAFDSFWVYELDEEQLEKFYTMMSQNRLQITEHHNGEVKGTVLVNDKDSILFTSIPYDTGWKVACDSGEAEVIPLLNGAMIGLRFSEPGNREIALTYEAPGLHMGGWVSGISVVLFILLWIISARRNARDKKTENE